MCIVYQCEVGYILKAAGSEMAVSKFFLFLIRFALTKLPVCPALFVSQYIPDSSSISIQPFPIENSGLPQERTSKSELIL